MYDVQCKMHMFNSKQYFGPYISQYEKSSSPPKVPSLEVFVISRTFIMTKSHCKVTWTATRATSIQDEVSKGSESFWGHIYESPQWRKVKQVQQASKMMCCKAPKVSLFLSFSFYSEIYLKLCWMRRCTNPCFKFCGHFRKVVLSNKNQICMYTSSPRKAVGDIMPVLLATTMAIPKHCWSL